MYQNNFRISDLQSSGLDKFIVDPDGSVQYAIIEEHVRENLKHFTTFTEKLDGQYDSYTRKLLLHPYL